MPKNLFWKVSFMHIAGEKDPEIETMVDVLEEIVISDILLYNKKDFPSIMMSEEGFDSINKSFNGAQFISYISKRQDNRLNNRAKMEDFKGFLNAKFVAGVKYQLKIEMVLKGIFNVLLLFPEVIFKYIGSVFSTLYNKSLVSTKELEGWKKAFSYVGMAFTGLLNVLIGQPLFFFGNMFAHARHFGDALVSCCVSPWKEKGAFFKSCKALGKSALNLAVGLAAGSFCYGLAALFAVIPGFQFLVPLFSGLAMPLKGSVTNIITNMFTNLFTQPIQIAKSLGTHHLQNSSVALILQGLSSTTANMITGSFIPGVKKKEDENENNNGNDANNIKKVSSMNEPGPFVPTGSGSGAEHNVDRRVITVLSRSGSSSGAG